MKLSDHDFLISYAEKWLEILGVAIGFGGTLVSTDLKIIKQIYPTDVLDDFADKNISQMGLLDYIEQYMKAKLATSDAIAMNMKAIYERRAIRRLEVHNVFDTEPRVYMIFQHPVINPDTNNVVGLFVFGYPVEVGNISGLLSDFYVYDSRYRSNLKKENIRLTKREQQVIFFFMLNFKSEQIGNLISKIEKRTVSKDAVDQLFRRQLFPKFDVVNRKALYDKLNKMGFAQVIPYNVLDEGFSVEITNNNVFI